MAKRAEGTTKILEEHLLNYLARKKKNSLFKCVDERFLEQLSPCKGANFHSEKSDIP